MTSIIQSGSLYGVEGHSVQVEVDLLRRLPCITIVGLPGNAIRESADRVRSAIQQSGFEFPRKRVIINLAPAGLKKNGAFFDLPIAIGILQANEYICAQTTHSTLFAGELSLSGALRPIKGALSLALLAKELGLKSLVIPHKNLAEACVVEGIDVHGFPDLSAVITWLQGGTPPPVAQVLPEPLRSYQMDMSDVKGQSIPKRALEISAAGGHNILLLGSPGCGKTMLAMRLPSILPTLSFDEAISITRIHSVRGLHQEHGLLKSRPFRAPHHSISLSGMVGTAQLLPGEASLAHNGVLFLDEVAEFRRDVLESLRCPLEEGSIQLSRANGTVLFPANFSLVAAANPCPCGWLHHPQRTCRCTPSVKTRYQNRLSGPLQDRIDLQVWVHPVPLQQLLQTSQEEHSKHIQQRVEQARQRQHQRFVHSDIHCNAQLTGRGIKELLELSSEDEQWLINILEATSVSARGWSKIIKVARTIADLEDTKQIQRPHLLEALSFNSITEAFQ